MVNEGMSMRNLLRPKISSGWIPFLLIPYAAYTVSLSMASITVSFSRNIRKSTSSHSDAFPFSFLGTVSEMAVSRFSILT